MHPDIDSMTLTLTPVPLSDAGADAEICISDGSFTLSGTTSANGTIAWTSSGDGSFDAPATENPTYTLGSETGSVYLIKTVSSPGSCAPDIDSMTLSLTPVPLSDAGADAEICISDGSFTLSGTTSANGTIAWTSSGDGSFDAPTADNPTYTLGSETGTVYLIKTVNSPGSCAPDIDSMTLTLTPVPLSDAGADAEDLYLGRQLYPERNHLGQWNHRLDQQRRMAALMHPLPIIPPTPLVPRPAAYI